jgi:hypothetical protein
MVSRNWPDQPVSTISPEFFRLQLEAANLDSILPCTESFENSYCTRPTYKFPIRDRSKGDDTDFSFIIPTERNSANAFFFDGITSRNETITLRGQTLTERTGAGGTIEPVDTYYILNRNEENPSQPIPGGTGNYPYKYNTASPILALVSDSFFIFQYDKLAVYESGRTWKDIFEERFPGLSRKLRVAAQKELQDKDEAANQALLEPQ